MDRKLIKEEAKKMFNNNKWNIWKPLLVIGLIGMVIGIISSMIGIGNYEMMGTPGVENYIVESFGSLVGAVLSVGYIYYMINFVKTGKFMTLKEAFEVVKEKWIIAALGFILISIFTSIGFFLLIVPGIIIALGFSMFYYLLADIEVIDVMDGIRKSWDMMKGYKWDFFVFSLSFIGWILLISITCGIAAIWVIPYMQTAYTIYYLKLKELKEIK